MPTCLSPICSAAVLHCKPEVKLRFTMTQAASFSLYHLLKTKVDGHIQLRPSPCGAVHSMSCWPGATAADWNGLSSLAGIPSVDHCSNNRGEFTSVVRRTALATASAGRAKLFGSSRDNCPQHL